MRLMLNPKIFLIANLMFCFIFNVKSKQNSINNQEVKDLIQKDSVKVIGISDGDTFTVLFQNKPYKIRIQGIDAPEKKMPFGKNSKIYLSDLIFNRYVNLKITKIDRYQRFVANVYLKNQTNIGYLMIKKGLAWHFKKYSKDKNMDYYEQIARESKIGLWIDNNPIPPWEYRKNKTKHK